MTKKEEPLLSPEKIEIKPHDHSNEFKGGFLKNLSYFPQVIGNPTNPYNLVNKQFVENLIRSSILAKFTAGESLVAGKAVYLKKSDAKLYKTDADFNDERIHNFQGIIVKGGGIDDDVLLQKAGRIAGFALPIDSATISETLDWNTYSPQANDDYCTLHCDGNSFCFTTGDYVANITKIIVKLRHRFSGEVSEQRVLNSVTLAVAGTGGSKEVACTAGCSGNNGQGFTREWTFTFDTPIVVQPRTPYIISMMFDGGSGCNVTWTGTGSGETCAHGTISFVYRDGSPGGLCINDSDRVPMMKSYYTSAKYCSIGDNVYLTDTPGGIDYIPGTYQKAIGTILNKSEILLPYIEGKLIERRGVEFNYGEQYSMPVPLNARMAVIEVKFHNNTLSAEAILINPIKMSYFLTGTSTSQLISGSWSGNVITLSATGSTDGSIDKFYITFLT